MRRRNILRTRSATATALALAVTIIGIGSIVSASSAVAGIPGLAVGSIANGSIGIQLLDIPVAEQDDPRARLYIIDRLAPSATIARRVKVVNTTSAVAHVLLYAAASDVVAGEFTVAADHIQNELSSWTTIAPSSVDVPAGGSAIATATVHIGSDAAPGERYAAIWAESRSSSASSSGVSEVNRVGIRLYISVGPGNAPAADFSVTSLQAIRDSSGHPTIIAQVRNTGGRALDMHGTLSLKDGPGGLSAGPFPATLGTTIGVHAIEPVRITLDSRLPNGPWSATLTLSNGMIQHDATATVTFPAAGSSIPVMVQSGNLWMWALITGAVVVVLVAIILMIRIRTRRSIVGASV